MIAVTKLKFKHKSSHGFCLGPITFNTKKNIVLKGSNGSGKTTLLKCLAGVLTAQEGEFSYPFNKIAFTSSYSTLPWSYLNGYEYIYLYNKLKKSNLTINEIKDLINKHWGNQFQFLNNKCYTFSSGQIKITKALGSILSNDNILIFDEPDSQLDNTNCSLLYNIFKNHEINKNKTLIFSSHNSNLQLDDFEIIKIYQGQLTDA